MQHMEFYVRESRAPFKETEDLPFQGGCHGNGTTLGYWIVVSVILIQGVKNKVHTIPITLVVFLLANTLSAFIFINDTYLISIPPPKPCHPR